MARYKIINQNDGNIQQELKSTDMLNALLEAVEKLGYSFIQNEPDQYDKNMEEAFENDFDDDQDIVNRIE